MAKQHVVLTVSAFTGPDTKILSESLAFIEKQLKEINIGSKLMNRAVLISEEMISEFIKNKPEDAPLQVGVRHWMGDTAITLKTKGEEFDPYAGAPGLDIWSDNDTGADSPDAIRAILLRSMGDKLKYSHRNGVNSAKIIVGQSERSGLYLTLAALFLGIIFGLLLKFVIPIEVTNGITGYALVPVRTMFMNALKIIVGPVVFFSIVTCFSQFTNLSELGKIGAKVMATYMATTIVAVLLAFGIFTAIKPGEPGFALAIAGGARTAAETGGGSSVLETIVNIVPSNFLKPFIESDTLQLIFLAVICGIAVGRIGEYKKIIKDLFEALNSLFLMITSIITRFIPLAVFASMSVLVANLDAGSFRALLSYIGTFVLSILLMLVFYGLLILVFGRLNPFRFYKNNYEGMLTSFSLCSSSASMPTNLKVCTEKMGIAPKVSNFSIPLGATVNMDGGCIYLVVGGLFLARAYGVDIPLSVLISLAVMVVLLSLSAPGISGVGLVNLGIILTALGIPVEAISIIIGVYPLLDMFITMSNTTGDVATSVIVAKSEKLLDKNVYYGTSHK